MDAGIVQRCSEGHGVGHAGGFTTMRGRTNHMFSFLCLWAVAADGDILVYAKTVQKFRSDRIVVVRRKNGCFSHGVMLMCWRLVLTCFDVVVDWELLRFFGLVCEIMKF